jgi:hypothetical protein
MLQALRDADIRATPGSTRAAAASYAVATQVPLKSILQKGDWARASTLFGFYVRSLPAETLTRINDAS